MSAQPIEIRMAHLEGAYEQMSERLRGIDDRLTALDQKIDSRFDAVDKKFTAVYVTVLSGNAAILAAIAGTIVVLHH